MGQKQGNPLSPLRRAPRPTPLCGSALRCAEIPFLGVMRPPALLSPCRP